MKLSKKITAKEILGPVAQFVSDNVKVGETVKCYAVAGIAKGITTGVATFGEWTAFVGDFQATHYMSGEITRAPRAFIPEPLCSMLSTAMADNETIEFAFEVSVTRKEDDDKGAIDFEYGVHPLTEVGSNDALGHLTKLIAPPKPTKKAS